MKIRTLYLMLISVCLIGLVSCSGNKTHEEEPKEDLKAKAAVTLDSILSANPDFQVHSIEYVQAEMPIALSEDIQEAYKTSSDALSAYLLALALGNDNLKDEKKQKELENTINAVLVPFRDKAIAFEKENKSEKIFALVKLRNSTDTINLNKKVYIFDVKDPSTLSQEISVDENQSRMIRDILQVSYAPLDSIFTSSYNEVVNNKIKESAVYSFIAD